ncbi:serine hydrolase domain-containing protein [Tardiphaga sp. 709]|uniref:serine hydrolase domain-containing protein n=1 Tax=Tardiphaga sp. 709 TaxID=3076039 RepID=UPI0028EF3503|nr:serine hydrolase domain-containing protein [Tardiphaga sp. 709]WNV08130.1 serine hydrolase domain-containing protein [Tardiphaga sp. 709]
MKHVIRPGSADVCDDADVVVPWWSFTKTLIAATALTMVRDHQLALDESLPGQTFTLRQLLQHRAGLADYGSLPAYHAAVAAGEDAWPVDRLLHSVSALHAGIEPGHFAYSNVGYLLVRQHLEQMSGLTLDVVMRRRLFEPLGVVGPRIASQRSDLADVRMGDVQSYDPRWVYHGLAVGTLRDAAMLLHRLMTTDLLPAALRNQMCDGLAVSDPGTGRPWRRAAYGLGVMTGTAVNGLRVVGHTGGGPGSGIAVYHCPEHAQATVAVFATGGAAGNIEADAFKLGLQR